MIYSSPTKFLGFALYSKVDLLLNIASVIDSMHLLLDFPFSSTITKIMYFESEARRKRRILSINLPSIDLSSELAGKEIGWISATDVNEWRSIVWHTDYVRRFSGSGRVNDVVGVLPWESGIVEQVLDWMKAAAKGMASVYGFVDIYGMDVSAVRQYCAATVTNALPGPQNRDCAAWQRNQEFCDEYVRNTYWGNVLSPGHLRRLGGFERLRAAVIAAGGVVEQWGDSLTYAAASRPHDLAATDGRVEALRPLVVPEHWLCEKL